MRVEMIKIAMYILFSLFNLIICNIHKVLLRIKVNQVLKYSIKIKDGFHIANKIRMLNFKIKICKYYIFMIKKRIQLQDMGMEVFNKDLED